MMKKILVVAAHPDDEVLGCGGTIAKFVFEDNEVYTLVLGEGITSRDQERNRGERESDIQDLKSQLRDANKILGVKDCFLFDFPDNRFDSVALLDIVKVIEKIKEKVAPQVVFTHHHGDLNIDHQLTFKAVMTAFRPVTGGSVKEIYSFEIPSSSEWNGPGTADFFRPNLFIDISKTKEKKMEALKKYGVELKRYPHPRSLEAIDILSKQRGIQVGLDAAEAFETVRIISS